VLPYTRPGKGGPLTLVPDGAISPVETDDELRISRNWRVIATMNVFDKSLLFEMSYALMRRFAFIEVPSPRPDWFESLVSSSVSGDPVAGEIASRLLAVRDVKDIGPAAFITSRGMSSSVGSAVPPMNRLCCLRRSTATCCLSSKESRVKTG
jgi:hypothetical protein